MKLKIKTKELQEMVSKVCKCVSNNKLIPLTSLLNIKVADHVLTLTATDATNYFYVIKPEKVDCEDFELSVMADLFARLVSKTTSEDIEFTVESEKFKVKGNGNYTMDLPLDENGSVIKFPNRWDKNVLPQDVTTIKVSTIKTILAVNKTSLSVDVEIPCLTCYYCADKVITSDRFKICSTDIKVMDEPILISSPLMDLLGIVSGEDIKVCKCANDVLLFMTPTEVIYAPIQDGVETFPVEAITGLVEQEFTSNCKVARHTVLNVLDRLSLFVSPYDKKGINLTFTNDGILFSSKKSNGTELVPYITSENFVPYKCCIDIEMLKSQIATQDTPDLYLAYGSEVAIEMVNNNIKQVVALMEDEID